MSDKTFVKGDKVLFTENGVESEYTVTSTTDVGEFVIEDSNGFKIYCWPNVIGTNGNVRLKGVKQ